MVSRTYGRGRKRVSRSRAPYRRIRGRGGYWQDFTRHALESGGAALGTAAGAVGGGTAGMLLGPPGAAYGAAAGGILGGAGGYAAGRGVSQLVGSGAYAVRSNSLMVDEGQPVPMFGDMSQATRVKHREYIADIFATGSSAFRLQNYFVNPGLESTFPWLSSLATNYQQYELLGMCFEFVSTSTEYNSSIAMGTVIMATDYDSVDANFSSKMQMENSQYCSTGKPSSNIQHCIECDPHASSYPIKYTRFGAVPSGKDQRLYDHANFQIAIQGMGNISNGTAIGELWVTYDVALYKPTLQAGQVGNEVNLDTFIFNSTNAASIADSGHAYFGTAFASISSSGSLGGSLTTNQDYTFPATISTGTYLFVYGVVGSSTALSSTITITATTNCTQGSVTSPSVTPVQTSTTVISKALIVVTGGSAVVRVNLSAGAPAVPSSPTSAWLYVIQVPNSGVTL